MLMCKLIELGWGTRNRAFRQVFATQFLPDASAEMIDSFDELQRESSSASDALRIMQVSIQVDVTGLARAVEGPTLIIHATEGGRIPSGERRVLASLIPGARFMPPGQRDYTLFDAD